MVSPYENLSAALSKFYLLFLIPYDIFDEEEWRGELSIYSFGLR